MSTELNQLDGDDEVPIRALGVHILGVYAPLRQAGTGQIVALVETYDVATELYYEVRAAQALVWLIFGASAIGFISLLVYPDWEGSKRDLAHQRREERVSNAGRACQPAYLGHERIAHAGVVVASRPTPLQRCDRSAACGAWGTDLTKGPVQLVGLALLKLEALRALVIEIGAPADPNSEDFGAIRQALTEALDEIRNLSESLVRAVAGRYNCHRGASA